MQTNWKAIAIDDNRGNLDTIKAYCNNHPDIQYIKGYLDPNKYYKRIKEYDDVNLYFLDIEMPGIKGDVLYDEIKMLYPQAHIIFTSGAVQHGTTATLKGAMALSKPILETQFNQIIELINNPPAKIKAPNNILHIKNIHRFIDSKKSTSEKWVAMNIDSNDLLMVSTLNSKMTTEKNTLFLYLNHDNHIFALKNISLTNFNKDHLQPLHSNQHFQINKSTIIHRNAMYAFVENDNIITKINNTELTCTLSQDRIDSFTHWLAHP